jgi:hypothetical protein
MVTRSVQYAGKNRFVAMFVERSPMQRVKKAEDGFVESSMEMKEIAIPRALDITAKRKL